MADTAAQDRGSNLRQDEAFLRRAFHRALLPCVLSILSENINILVDGILVGQRIGTDGLVRHQPVCPGVPGAVRGGIFFGLRHCYPGSQGHRTPAAGAEPETLSHGSLGLPGCVRPDDCQRVSPSAVRSPALLCAGSGHPASGAGVYHHHAAGRAAEDPDLYPLLVPPHRRADQSWWPG